MNSTGCHIILRRCFHLGAWPLYLQNTVLHAGNKQDKSRYIREEGDNREAGKWWQNSPAPCHTPCHTNVVSGDVHREPGSCPLIVFGT